MECANLFLLRHLAGEGEGRLTENWEPHSDWDVTCAPPWRRRRRSHSAILEETQNEFFKSPRAREPATDTHTVTSATMEAFEASPPWVLLKCRSHSGMTRGQGSLLCSRHWLGVFLPNLGRTQQLAFKKMSHMSPFPPDQHFPLPNCPLEKPAWQFPQNVLPLAFSCVTFKERFERWRASTQPGFGRPDSREGPVCVQRGRQLSGWAEPRVQAEVHSLDSRQLAIPTGSWEMEEN